MADKYTDEQLAVIEAAVNTEARVISVDALPGSGKTTVVEGIAEKVPDERVLYLVFNEHNAKEAKDRLGSNVDVQSFHKLAYKATLGSQDRKKSGSDKNVLTDDTEKAILFDTMFDDLAEEQDISYTSYYDDYQAPDGNGGTVETNLSEDDVFRMVDSAGVNEERARKLLADPLMIYLNENFNMAKRKGEFSLNTGWKGVKVEHEYSKLCLDAYLVDTSLSGKFGASESAKQSFYKSLVEILEKTLEGGNLEVESKYHKNSVPWKKASRALEKMLNVNIKAEQDTKDFAKLANRVIEGCSNEMIQYQLDMKRDSGIYHSTYLAEYGNSNAPFQMGNRYDRVLLDEGQDTNPACWKVIRAMMNGNSNLKLGMVGDQHQSIYSFRQARNVLNESPSSKIDPVDPSQFTRFALTKVFRVGGEVADVANAILVLRHKHLTQMAKNKMLYEHANLGFDKEMDVIDQPLFMCDADDKDRGRVVSSVLNKPVLDAFKETVGTQPAIICSRNFTDEKGSEGVLGEFGKELSLGRRVTLPKGGKAYNIVTTLAVIARLKSGSFIDMPGSIKEMHDVAFITAVKSMAEAVNNKPGFLLEKKYGDRETGAKELAREVFEDRFGLEVNSETGYVGPITDQPGHVHGRGEGTGMGKAIFERVLIGFASDHLTESTVGANARVDDYLEEGMEILKPGADKKSIAFRTVESKLRALTETYKQSLGLILLGEAHVDLLHKFGNTGSIEMNQIKEEARQLLINDYGMSPSEAAQDMGEWSNQINDLIKTDNKNEAFVLDQPCSVMATTITGVPLNKFEHSLMNKLESSPQNDRELFNGDGGGVDPVKFAFLSQLARAPKTQTDLHDFSQQIVIGELGMDMDDANVLVGTVHKTKGLEYPYVGLSDDIKVPTAVETRGNPVEAWNAALIAATRSTHGMVLNKGIEAKILTMGGYNPISSKLLADASESALATLSEVLKATNTNDLKELINLEDYESATEYEKDQKELNPDELSIKWLVKEATSVLTSINEVKDDLDLLSETGKRSVEQVKQLEIAANSVSLLLSTANELGESAKAIFTTDVIAESDIGSVKTKFQDRCSSLDLGGELAKHVNDKLSGELDSLSYGFSNKNRAFSVMAAGTTLDGNPDFVNMVNGNITPQQYVERRNLDAPAPGMSKEDADVLYGEIADHFNEMIVLARSKPENLYHLSNSVSSSLRNIVEEPVIAHLAKKADQAIEALGKSNGDYVDAFKDQLTGTTNDPDSFYQLDVDERQRQQKNENRMKQRTIENNKSRYEEMAEKTQSTGHSR